SATSQQGILNVIHGERQYRVLDANNRDITAKLKAFIKEKQKQQQLKKKYAKRKKRQQTNEDVNLFKKKINLHEAGGAAAKKIIEPIVDPIVTKVLKLVGIEAAEGAVERG
ncbi:MAG: hypothetical protein ACK55I_25720, partial [bacterium]